MVNLDTGFLSFLSLARELFFPLIFMTQAPFLFMFNVFTCHRTFLKISPISQVVPAPTHATQRISQVRDQKRDLPLICRHKAVEIHRDLEAHGFNTPLSSSCSFLGNRTSQNATFREAPGKVRVVCVEGVCSVRGRRVPRAGACLLCCLDNNYGTIILFQGSFVLSCLTAT